MDECQIECGASLDLAKEACRAPSPVPTANHCRESCLSSPSSGGRSKKDGESGEAQVSTSGDSGGNWDWDLSKSLKI